MKAQIAFACLLFVIGCSYEKPQAAYSPVSFATKNPTLDLSSYQTRNRLRPATYNDFHLEDTYRYPDQDGYTNIIYVYRADDLELEQIVAHFKLEAEKEAAPTPALAGLLSGGFGGGGGGFGGGGGGAVVQQGISGVAIGSLLGIGAG